MNEQAGPSLRLMFLLPFPSRRDADHGGGRAIAQLLHRLSARHTLALLYLRGTDEPPLDEELRARCDYVEEVPRPAVTWSGGLLPIRSPLVSSVWSAMPIWALEWRVKDFKQAVRRAAASWQPDLVQIEFSIMGQYLSALDDCPAGRVLVEHDPGAAAAEDRRLSMSGLSRFKQSFEVWAWQRYLQAVFHRVQALVVFSARDRRAVSRLAGRTPVIQIPPGVDLPGAPLNPTGAEPASLLFLGSYRHPPNVDAALRLIEQIFPALHARHPSLKLYLLGSSPPPVLHEAARRLNIGSQVMITGRVPDVTPYLDAAALVVAPLRQGGGMRIKVMEAMAHGKAVVASPLAASGMEQQPPLLLAESDQDFVAAVDQLLNFPHQRAALGREAHRWACTHLDWENSAAAYEALYQRLIEAKP